MEKTTGQAGGHDFCDSSLGQQTDPAVTLLLPPEMPGLAVHSRQFMILQRNQPGPTADTMSPGLYQYLPARQPFQIRHEQKKTRF